MKSQDIISTNLKILKKLNKQNSISENEEIILELKNILRDLEEHLKQNQKLQQLKYQNLKLQVEKQNNDKELLFKKKQLALAIKKSYELKKENILNEQYNKILDVEKDFSKKDIIDPGFLEEVKNIIKEHK